MRGTTHCVGTPIGFANGGGDASPRNKSVEGEGSGGFADGGGDASPRNKSVEGEGSGGFADGGGAEPQ
jgi:hypothetical protein